VLTFVSFFDAHFNVTVFSFVWNVSAINFGTLSLWRVFEFLLKSCRNVIIAGVFCFCFVLLFVFGTIHIQSMNYNLREIKMP